MALQTSVNRCSSLRSSSDARHRVVLESVVLVERIDRLLEAVSFDEPHGVIRASVGVGAQTVDRHDARMLEPACDFGLDHESLAADRVVGVRIEDLLPAPPRGAARRRARRTRLPVHRGRAAGARETAGRRWPCCRRQCSPCVRPLPVRSGRGLRRWTRGLPRSPDRRSAPGVHVLTCRQKPPPGSCRRRHHAPRGEPRPALPAKPAGRSDRSPRSSRCSASPRRPVEHPRLEGRQKLSLIDDPVLKREQPQEKVAIRRVGHAEAPITGPSPIRRGCRCPSNFWHFCTEAIHLQFARRHTNT